MTRYKLPHLHVKNGFQRVIQWIQHTHKHMKYTYRMIGACFSRFCVSGLRESLETCARALQPLDGDGLYGRKKRVHYNNNVCACAYVYSSQQQQHRRNDTQPKEKPEQLGSLGTLGPRCRCRHDAFASISEIKHIFLCACMCVCVSMGLCRLSVRVIALRVCVHLLCWLNKLTHACANVKEKPTTSSYLPMYVRLFFFLLASRVGSHVWRITPQ